MSSPIQIIASPGSTALVLDSPHSGTHYPDDFAYACDMHALRRAEDTHVEKLYSFAPGLGCAWVEALFPRSYVDANRSELDIDQAMLAGAWPGELQAGPKTALGKGLAWRLLDDGGPIYDRLLSVAELQARVANCWQPYHEAVRAAIDAAHARHGYSIHINCHSMPAVAGALATGFPGEVHPDFVLGNRDNTSSSPELLHFMQTHLQGLGYSVALNHPYKGVELVRRYSDPAKHRHSVQIELNCGRYMTESTREPHAGFADIQASLKSLVEALLRVDPRGL